MRVRERWSASVRACVRGRVCVVVCAYDFVVLAKEGGDHGVPVARERERQVALGGVEGVHPARHVLGSAHKVLGVRRPIDVRHISVVSYIRNEPGEHDMLVVASVRACLCAVRS